MKKSVSDRPEDKGIRQGVGLPTELERFIAAGKRIFRLDDGDWEIQIKPVGDSRFFKPLPPEAVVIAGNGCGDYLYLATNEGGVADPKVYVFWHEEQRTEVLAEHVKLLTDPPPPAPSPYKPIHYADGITEVRLGDEVSMRVFFVRRGGRVVYLPGVSKKNREMENGGLCWVGIRIDRGPFVSTIVFPETWTLKKKVRFIKRSSEPILELGPNENLD